MKILEICHEYFHNILILFKFIFHYEIERTGESLARRSLARERADLKPCAGPDSTIVAWLQTWLVTSPHTEFTDMTESPYTVYERGPCRRDAGVQWFRESCPEIGRIAGCVSA